MDLPDLHVGSLITNGIRWFRRLVAEVGSTECRFADDGSIKIPLSCARNDHFFAVWEPSTDATVKQLAFFGVAF